MGSGRSDDSGADKPVSQDACGGTLPWPAHSDCRGNGCLASAATGLEPAEPAPCAAPIGSSSVYTGRVGRDEESGADQPVSQDACGDTLAKPAHSICRGDGCLLRVASGEPAEPAPSAAPSGSSSVYSARCGHGEDSGADLPVSHDACGSILVGQAAPGCTLSTPEDLPGQQRLTAWGTDAGRYFEEAVRRELAIEFGDHYGPGDFSPEETQATHTVASPPPCEAADTLRSWWNQEVSKPSSLFNQGLVVVTQTKGFQSWGTEFRDPDLAPLDFDAPTAPFVGRVAPPPTIVFPDVQSVFAITHYQAVREPQALDAFIGPWQVENDDLEGRLLYLESTFDWIYCIQDPDLQMEAGDLWMTEMGGLKWQIAHRQRGCCAGNRLCECGEPIELVGAWSGAAPSGNRPAQDWESWGYELRESDSDPTVFNAPPPRYVARGAPPPTIVVPDVQSVLAGATAKGLGKPLQLWGLEFRDPGLDPVDLDAPPAPHVARIAPPPIFMCSDLQSFIAITEFQALSELQALDDFVGPWQVANDDCEGRLQFLQSTIDWVYCIQDFDLQEAIGQLWTWEICGLDWQIAHRNRGCCMGSRTCECGVRVYDPGVDWSGAAPSGKRRARG